jgi:LysM repeat protein
LLRRTPARAALFLFALVLGLSSLDAGPMRIQSAGAAPMLDVASYGAIGRAGVSEIGRFGGECRVWVQRIVRETTGVIIGSDYHLGFLQAGGTEVPLASAQHGDIIQLADPNNTLPSADYAGLHTAIVLDNLGGGKFRVVESNMNFDGMVGVRDWDPLDSAKRFPNIKVRAYRLPGAPLRPPSAQAAAAAPAGIPLASGVMAVVLADGDCLRVRADLGLNGRVVGCVATGTQVTVLQVGADMDGYRWSRVNAGSSSGWVADKYLHGIAAASVAASVAPPEPPKPPSTEGKIIAGAIPESGFGLLVYGGGSTEKLVEAANCARASLALWASLDGKFVSYVPGATIAVVNAQWNEQFGEAIPPSTALIGRCDAGAASSVPASEAPATAAEAGAASAAAAPSEAANAAADQQTAAPEAPAQAAPPEQVSAPPPPPAAEPPATYVVVEGDTLSGIAAKFCPTDADLWEYMEALRTLNGLDEGGVLSVGAELRLPPAG